MNGYMAQALGQGTLAAGKEVRQGLDNADKIKTRRELQQRANDQQDLTNQRNADSDGRDVAKHEQEMKEMKFKFKELENQALKRETFDAFTAYRRTGDAKFLNQPLQNPKLKALMNGVTGIFKLDIETGADAKLMRDRGITPSDKDLKNGRYVKVYKSDGGGKFEILDMHGAYARLGYTKVMSAEEIAALANQKTEVDIENTEANIENTKADIENTKADTEATKVDTTSKKYKQKDMEKHTGDGGTTVPVYLDGNTGTGGSGGSGSGKVDPKQLAEVQLFAKKISAEGYTGTSENPEQAQLEAENYIKANITPKELGEVTKSLTIMEANHRVVDSIYSILKDVDSQDPDVKANRNVIDNVKTSITKIFGSNSPKVLNDVNFNTKTGLLLAKFMKEISGSAVSTAEVDRLTKIFSSGDLSDMVYVKGAMKAFSSSLRDENSQRYRANRKYAPHSIRASTNYKEDRDKKQAEEVEAKAKKTKIAEKYNARMKAYGRLIGKTDPTTSRTLMSISKTTGEFIYKDSK